MIKAFLRFSLLLLLGCMLVYAPEILSGVSAPYNLTMPQRTLLRIAMHCDSSAASLLQQIVSAYQKQYPQVHIRISILAEEMTSSLPPYPDVILCSPDWRQQLPAVFSSSGELPLGSAVLICALRTDPKPVSAAEEFAAFIYEATLPQVRPSEI